MSELEDGSGAHGQHSSSHVVPFWTLARVFAALVALTVLTVAVTHVDLGRAALLAALGIATVKATLVLLFFMHLRWDRPFNGALFVTTLLFVALFISFVLMDSAAYRGDLVPDGPPAAAP